jgi:acetolactate synthase regulatory subunit
LPELEFADEIAAALHESGHEVVDPMFEAPAEDALATLSSAIFNADLVIAVVTRNNPNVFYELGLAAGAGIPTLVTGSREGSLPFDLLSVPYFQPSGDHARDAYEIVRRAEAIGNPRPRKVHPVAGKSAVGLLSEAAQNPAMLESIPPHEFEYLLARLFEEQGFNVSSQSDAGDWGVDFVVDSGRPVAVEVKKTSRQSRVSAEVVRGLLAALAISGAPLGVLISTSGFTSGALALAEGTRVALLTLEQLLADPSLSAVTSVEPE